MAPSGFVQGTFPGKGLSDLPPLARGFSRAMRVYQKRIIDFKVNFVRIIKRLDKKKAAAYFFHFVQAVSFGFSPVFQKEENGSSTTFL
jgi:hypothetical protein